MTKDDDMLKGADQIGAYIDETEAATFKLCQSGAIPAYKLAGRWRMRKSVYDAHVAALQGGKRRAS